MYRESVPADAEGTAQFAVLESAPLGPPGALTMEVGAPN